MKRLASRKSHSWWWDSHISPKNSRWLSKNLERMDRLVKEMLKLIEEEGDTFAKKAEMYYQRRPELISHVEDFYRMYRALAERYDIVTGELRKNMPSDLQSQGSGNSSDFGTEPVSPSFSLSPDQTPERKQNLPKPSRRAAGFDVFVGSTVSSDFSRKGSDDSSSSSSSSESGSDSDDGKVVDAYESTSGLNARIIQLEDELREAREKIKEYEKGSNGQCVHLVRIDEHHDPEDEIVAEVTEVEAELHPESEDRTVVLEAEISTHKGEIKRLKEAMEAAAKQFEAEISLKDHAIEGYKTQLDAAMNKFMQDKSTLEAELKSSIADLKLEAMQLSEQKCSLEIRILEQEQMIEVLMVVMSAESSEKLLHEKSILKSKVCNLMNSENIHASKLQTLEDRIRELEAEKIEACNKSAKRIAELNQSLDGSKLKIDMLTSEKDDLNATVSKLMDDAKCRDENCRSMADHLHQLHLELEAEKTETCNESAKRIAELNQSLDGSKLKIDMLTSEKDELNARVSKLMDDEKCRDDNIRRMADHLHQLHLELEAEKTESCNESAKRIAELNQSLDGSKLKIDMLTSEKDELNARVSKLMDDAKCRDDNSRSMADHLHQLHLEHVNLIKEIEEARENSVELMNKVKELEEEVEKQRVLILDGAEGKREAIRQLCFSLEHYRDGYQKLRQMLQGHTTRLVVMAT